MSKTIEGFRQFYRGLHPTKRILIGYSLYILIGWLLLNLPFLHKVAGVNALDNLFISTSAVSTTGLTTISIADSYNFLGQLVVMILIQLGGIGYMTIGSFVILSRKGNFTEERAEVGKTVFSLPVSFRIDKFVRSVVVFTLVIEVIGALILYTIFADNGAELPLWSAVFHSVSAFCTAGFSLYNNSFESFAGNFWINITIGILSYLGAIGFIVFVDFWRKITGKVKLITLTSKIILHATLWLTLLGTFLIFIAEPSIQYRTLDERILASFFQAMTAFTTVGFNTIPIASLSKATLLLVIVLMVIGASPSGTGGGLKSTTFSALIGVLKSALRGEKEVRFWGRAIPLERVWTAIASIGFYIFALLIGTYLLELTEPSAFEQNFFEAASALGTVGLSTGITSALTSIGKIIIIALMFCGRLGPLTFGVALFTRDRRLTDQEDNDLAV